MEQPDCAACGHPSDSHTYDPSGCNGTACNHCDEGFDEHGWPKGPYCPCGDYALAEDL